MADRYGLQRDTNSKDAGQQLAAREHHGGGPTLTSNGGPVPSSTVGGRVKASDRCLHGNPARVARARSFDPSRTGVPRALP